ncbi:MAG: tripartite tricarboxylate transporter substrate binding protein [Burkholderiaceae bacterium]|jgi:tripartite-type tricarboxylate transporter receptor subunit TctC|nr:tripartite tricarboxylate transporter substrate binding protein [Burkholderiaceae bacterium]NCW86293.1 tripartite tricarboxylate transporter substrate binding protein [Oxalobacteraceae bacterium]NDG06351.1 tripartite tricarboxylate transporter substrate binding protein [Oxalobacteraceae bacterium]
MFFRYWARTIAILLLSLGIAHTAHAADNYPTRPITLIVPFAAGGGTDGVARIIGTLLEKELGQPVNVVNRAGGNGVVGHAAIAAAAADGYTLGMVTVDITMLHWAKLTPLTGRDFTPLALMNIDPAAIIVRSDAPYKKLDDLLKAIKANPGKFKSSGTGLGGIWHLAMAGMLKDVGIDTSSVPWVPSTGAAQAMNDLVAGGVEFVTCSLPEARALIDAGKARPLVIMSDKASSLYPNVPTLQAAANSKWTLGAWRGLAAPRNLPPDTQVKLGSALKKIYDSKAFQDFMASRGFGITYADAKAFEQFMLRGDADMGATMKSVGLVK